MSRRLKFQTVGRDQHRHGRVACLLDVDMVQKKLFLSLVEARGLDAGFGASIPNAFVNIRMQLLPHKNQALVREVSTWPLWSLSSAAPLFQQAL